MIKLIIIFFISLIEISLNAQVIYPEYTDNKVVDLSKKFDARYLNKLENDLNNSEINMKVVFIKSENKINLGIYASKLFEKWKMTDDSILVVIDPFTNKRGFAIGKKIKENLKDRKKVKDSNSINDNIDNDIDYNNLVDILNNKFSPDSLVKYSDKKSKNTFNQKESVNLGSSSSNNRFNEKNLNVDYSKLLKYIILTIFIAILSYLAFFLYNKKQKKIKNIETINNLSFEAGIKLQEIYDLIETLNQDLESVKNYKNKTKKYLEEEVFKIKDFIDILQKNYDNLSEELENISTDNIDTINKTIEDYNLLKIDIDKTHLELKNKRKEIKKIIKNSFENISNIRTHLDNNLRLIEENSKLYNLEISFIRKNIENMSNDIFNIDINNIKEDPIYFKEKILELEKSLTEMRKDIDTIPHLYLQINNQITEIINEKNLANDKEIISLKENILKNLNDGNMKNTSNLIEKMFNILNEKN